MEPSASRAEGEESAAGRRGLGENADGAYSAAAGTALAWISAREAENSAQT
jgi:hypothetical protein